MEWGNRTCNETFSENAPTVEDRTLAKQIISNLHYTGNNKVSVIKIMPTNGRTLRCGKSWLFLVVLRCTKTGLFRCGVSLNLIKLMQGICLGFDVHSLLTLSVSSFEGLLHEKCLPDKFTFINASHQATLESDEKDVVQKWCLNSEAITKWRLRSYIRFLTELETESVKSRVLISRQPRHGLPHWAKHHTTQPHIRMRWGCGDSSPFALCWNIKLKRPQTCHTKWRPRFAKSDFGHSEILCFSWSQWCTIPRACKRGIQGIYYQIYVAYWNEKWSPQIFLLTDNEHVSISWKIRQPANQVTCVAAILRQSDNYWVSICPAIRKSENQTTY